ncbi:P-loop containing nucleoside triphosphate hydrolase superfamily protein [Abeliophyllum distichum]|uniref:P-loop containing nucleoside triphosphate hydrolase superfamily protein n=1 Tax=Abeliophyllum distichum TaxID=126358 RepID=A0ABD1SVE9_9LAMI
MLLTFKEIVMKQNGNQNFPSKVGNQSIWKTKRQELRSCVILHPSASATSFPLVEEDMMDAVEEKKKEAKGLIDLVFSWSVTDVMNKDLYKNKVEQIPETFSSLEHYFRSFINPLIEETHANLRSNFTTLYYAPVREIFDVDLQHPNNLYYTITLRRSSDNEKVEAYEPGVGDLIALTDVRPKRIDDLDRPKRSYTIALVRRLQYCEGPFEILQVLSSKPIMFDREKDENTDKLFAVHLTNLTTDMRIWRALHPNLAGDKMKIFNSVLKVDTTVEENCTLCLLEENRSIHLSRLRESIGTFGMDGSQEVAILNCIVTRECHHRNDVKLIWGPPGTGKTKMIGSLLFVMLRMKCRALTCAPTNIAVIGVAKKLLSLISGTLLYDTYGLGDIVLFGNGKRMKIDDHEDLYNVFLDYRVSELYRCFAPSSGWRASIESMICLLEYPEMQYQKYLAIEKAKQDDEKKRSKQRELLQKRSQSKSDKDKGKNEKNKCKKGYILWTFKEFVTKEVDSIGTRIMLRTKGLYTNLPTSFLNFEVVKDMVRVLDMLKTLKLSIHNVFVANEDLRQALKGKGQKGRNFNNLCEIRLKCLEVLKLLLDKFSVPKFTEEDKIRNFCLRGASLIFCTASSSSKLQSGENATN